MNLRIGMESMFCTVQGKAIDRMMECLFHGRKYFVATLKHTSRGNGDLNVQVI